MLDALALAHRAGIVHCDVKPSNVLLDRSGGAPVAKVGDFGIARMIDQLGTSDTSTVLGTLHYLAPEVLTVPRPRRRGTCTPSASCSTSCCAG